MIKLKKLASNKIRLSLNFEHPQSCLVKSENFFLLFYNEYEEKMFTIEIEKNHDKISLTIN